MQVVRPPIGGQRQLSIGELALQMNRLRVVLTMSIQCFFIRITRKYHMTTSGYSSRRESTGTTKQIVYFHWIRRIVLQLTSVV